MAEPELVTVRLEPLGQVFEVARGTPLRDLLFAYGVEFPCGGHGRCRKCRVRLLEGRLPLTADEERILTAGELAEGWRLACRCAAHGDITLEIGQWETAILADDRRVAFTPREGFGVAVDVGTTTLVAQLLDLETGQVLGVRSALNPQTSYGSDVMSRVQTALARPGRERLMSLIRRAIGQMILELVESAAGPVRLTEVVLVGNTVMHHLFCGVDPEPLSHYPFRPADDGLKTFRARELGWELGSNPLVQFLPCLGGFVGSDILAGILATGLHEAGELTGLLDLGTNGEIVFGDRSRIVCASTAAGPAFEGGRISMGMRAATGAIAGAHVRDGFVEFRVLGGGAPRGICGSGLVDVVAAGLELGRIAPSGRFTGGVKAWPLLDPVVLLQRDVRELQLAKGAVAAGIRLLLGQLGKTAGELHRVHLAGAFGNYVDHSSARRIGLLDFPGEKIFPAGNTALLGAKVALLSTRAEEREFKELRRLVRHVPLADDPAFEEVYVGAMPFPEGN
jgi:uncharacterized 2Fe-2S/4Fe-4S cluster protein (DUF4445 family)